MKRNLLVLMLLTLLAMAIMTACSPKTEAPTAAPANSTAPTAYPAGPEPTTQTMATAYPATVPTTAPVAAPATTEKMTDEQVLALIETQLKEHHTMDFLLSKKLTADQWETVLYNESHNDVMFTPAEMEQVIAYLIANQK